MLQSPAATSRSGVSDAGYDFFAVPGKDTFQQRKAGYLAGGEGGVPVAELRGY